MAARLAFLLAPIAEIILVMQVPIFCPIIIGIATAYGTAPDRQSACKIPTDADELWIMAVRMAPIAIPKSGLEKSVIIPVNAVLSARPDTDALIVSIPNISTAKPSKIFPASFFLDSSLLVITRIIPIAARMGEKEEGFNIARNKLLPLIPVKDKIQDVMVVPILAPIMTPTACTKCISPELTKPTTITVVADDD